MYKLIKNNKPVISYFIGYDFTFRLTVQSSSILTCKKYISSAQTALWNFSKTQLHWIVHDKSLRLLNNYSVSGCRVENKKQAILEE